MSDDELQAGNETTCHMTAVFRQAAYKRRMAEWLYPNAVMELETEMWTTLQFNTVYWIMSDTKTWNWNAVGRPHNSRYS